MGFVRQSCLDSGLGGPLCTSDSARRLRYPVHLTVRLSLHWSMSLDDGKTVVVVERCELPEEAALQTRTMLETEGPTWVTCDPATGLLSELRRRLPQRWQIGFL